MDRLLGWLEVPIHLLFWIGLVAGVLMMIHVTVDVTGRTLFNHPFSGTTEIVAAYYMVAAAYLSWAWIARHDSHIRVEVFTRNASPRFNHRLDIAVKVLTIAYVSLFTWQTSFRAIQQFRAGEVWQAGGGFVPVWPSRWMLPLAGGFMAVYLVLRVISDIARGPRR